MGPYWYKSKRPRRGLYTSRICKEFDAWPPLVARRDRHNPLQYQGPTYAKSIWTVQDWTLRNMAGVGGMKLPLHMSMCEDDKVCSSVTSREFFEKWPHSEKVKCEYDLDHDLLASKAMPEILDSQTKWLKQFY